MKYFGVLSSMIIYILLFFFVIWFSSYFLNNRQSLWFNLGGVITITAFFYFFAIPHYKNKSGLISAFYLIATAAVCNFSLSGLNAFVDFTSEPPSLPKDDFSGIFTVPASFLLVIIWGWIFDLKKNKLSANE